MKPIIINMNEMSDSREVYETKPSRATAIFLYLCLFILIVAIVWMYFGRMDIVVKTQGVIRPNESVNTVVNQYSGKIREAFVEDGAKVEKDELLYVIEHQDLLISEAYYREQLELIDLTLEEMQWYQESVEKGTNCFPQENKTDEYAVKFRSYQINMDSLRLQNRKSEEEVTSQLQYLTEQLSFYTEEELATKKLLQSIEEGQSAFNKDEFPSFQNRYQMYESDYAVLKKQYEDKADEILASIQQESILSSYDYYMKMQEGLTQFQNSVDQKKDCFTENSVYQMQYQDYVKKRKSLFDIYERAVDKQEINQALQGLAVTEWEVEESRIAVRNAKKEYDNYRTSMLLELENQQLEVKKKLEELSLSKDTMIQKDTLLSQNEEAKIAALSQFKLKTIVELQSNLKSYEENLINLQEKKKTMEISKDSLLVYDDPKESVYGAVEKYRNDELSMVLQSIESYNSQRAEMQTAMNRLQENIASCYVRAQTAGVVNFIVELVCGDTLGAGTEVMTILPENDTEYKGLAYINNSDIGKVNENMEIKVNIYAYPNHEYGYLTGKITKISKDIKVDSQSGGAYYLAEASLNLDDFYDNEGKPLVIKPGMACETKIITGDSNILSFVLEKLSLLVKE